MTQKALKACLQTATEAYEQTLQNIEDGYMKKQHVYDVYFAAIYAIEGIVDSLCNTDEKVTWAGMVDKQRKEIRKLLKM